MEAAQRDANTKSSERVGVGGFSVVSIQVYSVELWIVPRTWPKERRIFTQNVFLVHAQTILEVKEILVQFHCLSSSPNDLYRNRTDFLRGWERVPSSLRPSLPPYLFPVLWLCQAVHYLFLCDFLVLEFIIAQLFMSQFSLWFPCHRISWWEVLRCGTDTECSKTKYFEIDPSFTAAPIAKSCSFSNGVWAEKAGIKDQSPGPW